MKISPKPNFLIFIFSSFPCAPVRRHAHLRELSIVARTIFGSLDPKNQLARSQAPSIRYFQCWFTARFATRLPKNLGARDRPKIFSQPLRFASFEDNVLAAPRGSGGSNPPSSVGSSRPRSPPMSPLTKMGAPLKARFARLPIFVR